MVKETLYSLNWVDLLVVVVAVRVIYIGFKRGFIVEIFKIVGLLFATFCAFHYYPRLSDAINPRGLVAIEFVDALCFGGILTFVLIIFKFVRDGFLSLVKMHPIPTMVKWGGVVLQQYNGKT